MTAMPQASGQGLVGYFGYGSLVNRATLRTDYVDIVPARLIGYRRGWRSRPDMPGFPAALLTVRPDAGVICDGVLVIDRAENLAAVDAREARYIRRTIDRTQVESPGGVPDGLPLYVYTADEALPPHAEPPRILRSYLDAVMQGFLALHGEDGLRRFIAETENFDIPVHEDRDRPTYPRAVSLTPAEVDLFDRLLAERGGMRFPGSINRHQGLE